MQHAYSQKDPHMPPDHSPAVQSAIRYSPRPISDYKTGSQGREYGPATSSILVKPGAWNLAYLSYDFERSLMHPDPHFTVNIRRTTLMQLDGSGLDLAGVLPTAGAVESLLHLPAARFVHLIAQHPVLVQLPMYQAYGHAWLKVIEERSFLCQTDPYTPDDIADLSLAQWELNRFR
jgi:hypothetical protein